MYFGGFTCAGKRNQAGAGLWLRRCSGGRELPQVKNPDSTVATCPACKEPVVLVCGGALPVDVLAATNVTAGGAALNDASVSDEARGMPAVHAPLTETDSTRETTLRPFRCSWCIKQNQAVCVHLIITTRLKINK